MEPKIRRKCCIHGWQEFPQDSAVNLVAIFTTNDTDAPWTEASLWMEGMAIDGLVGPPTMAIQ